MIEVGPALAPADVVAVAREGAAVALAPAAREAMERSAQVIARHAGAAEPVYGVTTGFGLLATVPIPASRREQLQRSLVRSHAAGIGEPVEIETVRAMMMLRVRSLAMGYSGARPAVAQAMLDLLNAAITPVVPEFGSVGASGDLAPLAHCALALIGEGEVFTATGEREPAARALAGAGLAPVELGAKEGLALINGTDGMLAMLLLALADLRVLLAARRHRAPRCRWRRCWAPTASSPPTWSRCARSPGRRRARRTCARCSPARRSSRAIARATRACRTPTRCAARRRCWARRATRSSTPSASRPTSSPPRSTTR